MKTSMFLPLVALLFAACASRPLARERVLAGVTSPEAPRVSDARPTTTTAVVHVAATAASKAQPASAATLVSRRAVRAGADASEAQAARRSATVHSGSLGTLFRPCPKTADDGCDPCAGGRCRVP